jgi:D-tyrosyl-tRNA(Tyr) deacylase
VRLLLQRVTSASVDVGGKRVAEIDQGLLIFAGAFPDDGQEQIEWLAEKVVNLRVFADETKPMNANIRQIGGDLLVVSQFTLAADTTKGNRPGFSRAAPPELAERLIEQFVDALKSHHASVATGVFGADMQVALVNDGPVTFVLDR